MKEQMNFALFVTMLSYRQKLEKAQLVVIHKITQSLHPTLPFIFFLFLLFFFFSLHGQSEHAASFGRKRCFKDNL